jgi:hypothetical protein
MLLGVGAIDFLVQKGVAQLQKATNAPAIVLYD